MWACPSPPPPSPLATPRALFWGGGDIPKNNPRALRACRVTAGGVTARAYARPRPPRAHAPRSVPPPSPSPLTCAAPAAAGLPKESSGDRYWDSAEGDELQREPES